MSYSIVCLFNELEGFVVSEMDCIRYSTSACHWHIIMTARVHLTRLFLVEDKMHIHLFRHVATTKVLINPNVYLFIHRLTPLFQSNACISFCLASVTNTKMVENALWKISRQVTPVAANSSSWTQLSIMTAIVTVSTTATAVAGSPFL